MTSLMRPEPGNSTAMPLNVSYRVGRIAELVRGRWLDLGCADGGYAAELLRQGAAEVVGVDAEEERIVQAAARKLPRYGPPRVLLALAFAFFVSGRAIVSNWSRMGRWSEPAMSLVLSLAVLVLLTTVMLWIHAWY